jgi:hypothetical protein
MPALQRGLAGIAAAYHNYGPQQQLNTQDELSMRRSLLQSQLDTAAQERQMRQAEFQTPAERQAMQLDTYQRQQDILHAHPERQTTTDAQGNVWSVNPYDPNDAKPLMVPHQVTVSSPEAPQVPFRPDQLITRNEQSQLSVAPKESGSDFERYYTSLVRNGQPDTPQNRLSAYSTWQQNSGATEASPFKAWRQQFIQANHREPNAKEIQDFTTAGAAMRIVGMENLRQDNYLDTTNGSVGTMTSGEFASGNKSEPGRYVKFNGQVSNALKAQSLINDIRAGISQMRAASNALPGDGLSSDARALGALAARSPENAVGVVISGMAGKNLSEAEQDYLIAHASLLERAMSLRGLQGQGAGSDQQRAAIAAMIPGLATANKSMAAKQLATLEGNVNIVASSIPRIGNRSTAGAGAPPAGAQVISLDDFLNQK